MTQENRPFIGINLDLLAGGKNRQGSYRLAAGYCDAILSAGGLPVPVPACSRESDLDTYLDMLSGFVLTGGADMDPRRNGQCMHPSVRLLASQREESDRKLVKKLLARKMPVLGIGLGMQQINVALGGSLYLHLPEEMPKSMPHLDNSDDFHRHLALIKPGTLLEEIYGGEELLVNSSHHQGVKTLGNNLRVCATAPDGVIEAIETVEVGWYFVGVQWHPEADSATALDKQLFENFLQASAALSLSPPLEIAV
ncbi:MAG: gamma-glutamyl-gamma-aminobutyrate hydrolase family protein [Gemmataceae bacterium]|nr:gamma-glutamyl-gamma-aminobutyrate hydrolase family protein [Gemmataceae bacterium]